MARERLLSSAYSENDFLIAYCLCEHTVLLYGTAHSTSSDLWPSVTHTQVKCTPLLTSSLVYGREQEQHDIIITFVRLFPFRCRFLQCFHTMWKFATLTKWLSMCRLSISHRHGLDPFDIVIFTASSHVSAWGSLTEQGTVSVGCSVSKLLSEQKLQP